MSKITGVVEKISTQEGKGARGPWTKKAFLINGEWFGAFVGNDNRTSLYSVSEGNAVEVEYQQSGEFKNLVAIKVTSEAQPSTVVDFPQGQIKTSKGESHPKAYNVEDKDRRITYLASRKDSLELVKFLIEKDFLKVPDKKADQADVVLGYAREYTNMLLSDAYSTASSEGTVNKVPAAEIKKSKSIE